MEITNQTMWLMGFDVYIIPLCFQVSKWCNLLLNISGPSPVNLRCVMKMAAAVEILLSLLLILHYSCGKSLSVHPAFKIMPPPQASYIFSHQYDSWGNDIVMYVEYIWPLKRGKQECWCNFMLTHEYFHVRALFDYCGVLFLLYRWGSWLLICCIKARLQRACFNKDQNNNRGQKRPLEHLLPTISIMYVAIHSSTFFSLHFLFS